MYQMNDIEMWREHRNELLREAEERRLGRRLRAERPKRSSGIGSTLLGRIHSRIHTALWTALGKGVIVRDCEE